MIPALITPINPTTGAPPVSIVAANVSGNAPQVPPNIGSLPPGTEIQGFVLNRDSNGNPILRTNLGDFLIQSQLFLRIGSDVIARIDATGRSFHASIIEVDGEPVSAEPKQAQSTNSAARQSAQDEIVRSRWIPELSSLRSADGRTELHAVLLNPSGAAAQSQGLKEGTALLVRLFNLQLPQASAASSGAPPTQAPAAQSAANHVPTTSTQSTPTSASPTAASTTAANLIPISDAPIEAITSPTSNIKSPAAEVYQSTNKLSEATEAVTKPTAPKPSAIPKEAMALTVIGQERDGEAVLQSPFGLVKITSNVTLPTGTQLLATLALSAQNASNQPLSSPLLNQQISLANLAQKWTSLTQILQILTEQNDGVLPTNIANILPSIQTAPQALQVNMQQAGAGLFLFLAALGSGDFRSALGDKNTKLLEKLGHADLLTKADSEFGMLARLAANQPAQGWNSMFMPVLVNNQVEMLRWFTRRDRERDKGGKNTGNELTRFVVEITLSQLGDMQLDGFYKAQSEQRQFDLTIRSHMPLDADIQQEIMKIFQQAGEDTGTKGSVIFQATHRFPILPLQEVLQNQPDVIA